MERDAEIVALFLGASFGSFSMTWPRNGQFGLGWEWQCQRMYFGTKELQRSPKAERLCVTWPLDNPNISFSLVSLIM